MTPLMYASKKGSADSVRALAKGGALVNQTVTGGITALMIAAMEGHTDALMALVEAGATT
jgi:ankyrin repeat protein